MNILAIAGSIRKDSFNMQLVKTMQERYEEKIDMKIADIGSLPFFNQDDEMDPPQVVKDFKDVVLRVDGVIIVTPEYNWSVPGVLKNALDWTSRGERVLIDKPVMILGATPGMAGTLRAQTHLRQILSAPGIQANVLPAGSNEILVNFAQQKFDEQTGRLADKSTLEFIDSKVDAFMVLINRGN